MKSRLVLSAILFGCVIQCSAQSQSPLLTEVTSSDGSANDTFGSSVSVQGNTMVVGAPSANVAGSQFRPGAAYVFTRTGSTWMQVAKLTPSDLGDDDFGASVAIGGSVIAVGGPKKNPNKLGGVYVFVQPQGGWTDATETALLNAGDLLVHGIGTHVAITGDGNKILATRPLGAAFLFVKPAGGWVSTTSPNAEMLAPPATVQFANSIAMTKDTAVVGSGFANVGGAGAAYVYSLNKNGAGTAQLQPIATLTPSDGGTNDIWRSVAISGNVIVAGAPYHSNGAAYVYVEPPSGWSDMTQTAELTVSGAPDNSFLGWSVATSGKNITFGAPGNQGALQGTLYLFTQPPSGWADSSTPNLSETAVDGKVGDGLGLSIAISGSIVVGGAPGHSVLSNKDQGAAYVLSPQ